MFSGVPKWFLAAQPSPGAAAVHNSGNTVSSGVDRVGENLWYLERKEDGSGWEPHSFLQTPFDEQGARFSPDGHYVAYVSNESGQNEVYVRPFPEGGRKVTVSSNGGETATLEPGRQGAVLCGGADLVGRFRIERFELCSRLGHTSV